MFDIDKSINKMLGKKVKSPSWGAKRTKKDRDGDGVPNKKDCQPMNPIRQDPSMQKYKQDASMEKYKKINWGDNINNKKAHGYSDGRSFVGVISKDWNYWMTLNGLGNRRVELSIFTTPESGSERLLFRKIYNSPAVALGVMESIVGSKIKPAQRRQIYIKELSIKG